MNIILKIFKQTFWQILGKIVTSVCTFIILGIVARNYKEEGTGLFTLALTYLTMFFLLGDFGFNAHVLRNLKSQTPLRGPAVKSEWQKLLGTRLIWSGILVVLAVTTLPFWPFATDSFSKSVIFGSLAILGSGIFITSNLIFQEKLRYDMSVIASSAGTVIYLFLVLVFSQNKWPMEYLLASYTIGWIFMGATTLFFVRNFIKNIVPIFDFSFIKNLVKESWPIAATLALNVIYFRADSFMLAFYKTPSDVGIYNLAYTIFQSVLVLPTFIMNAYYPLMLKSLAYIKWVGLGLLVLALLGTVATLFFSPIVINILTGGGFGGSAQSLQILSLGFPAYFLSAFLMWLLVAKGMYKKMLLLYTSGMIINLFLNFLYIPKYSFLAASWITVISEYIILIMQIITLRSIIFK